MSQRLALGVSAILSRCPRREVLFRLLLPTERLGRKGVVAGAALALLYASALAIQLVGHAMWLDEAQAWLIARASTSPLELRQNLRFEGHPPLWHLLIWPFARLSSDPELIKVLTFLIGSAFGTVIALGRAVPPLLRPVLLAGFLPILGYGMFSRPYLLGLLLAFAYLELLHRRGARGFRSLVARLGLLTALSLTHLMYAVLAGALLVGELLDVRRYANQTQARVVLGVSAAGMVVGTAAFLPHWSGAFIPRSIGLDRIRVQSVSDALIEASGLLPILGESSGLSLIVLLVLVGASVLLSPRRAWPMVGGVGLLVVNRIVGYGSEWWHVGVTTFALVIVALLALHPGSVRDEDGGRRATLARPIVSLLTLLVLAGQVTVTLHWFEDERSTLPYSGGREAAAIVRSWCESGCPVVVDWSSAGATVSAFLGAKPVYRLDDQREGTYAIWDRAYGTGEVSWDALREAMDDRGRQSIGVLSRLREPPEDFIVIGETGRAFKKGEQYLVVVLAPSR